jgi:hypothetical protein
VATTRRPRGTQAAATHQSAATHSASAPQLVAQLPAGPQTNPPQAWPGGGVPETLVQVPSLPGSAQDWQPPPQEASQQRPSAQAPEPHWLAAVQAEARALRGTQAPASQKSPATHSASAVQEVAQAPPGPHWKPPQLRPGGGVPETAVQAPAVPGRLQAWQAPPQAWSQQTPSEQVPEAHWLAAAQAAARATLGRQAPAWHQSPAAQSASAAQLVLQAVAPQANGAQALVEGAGQLPAPSQAAAAVAVPEAQEADRQLWAAPGKLQAATWLPSQLPPQAEPSLAQAERAPWGAPVTGLQVPTLPGRSQAWHWPPQAWLQQTPSAQAPVAHWLAAVQAPPLATLGRQAPAWHQSPAAQSASAAQLVLQAVAPQAKGAQAEVAGAGQLPAPSQLAAAVAVPEAQEAERQELAG